MTVIARLQAENYKRLKAVEIAPGEGTAFVPIIGRNAQGKSSVLDAIVAALGGKSYMPSHPVRKGEEEGAIRLELSNGLVVRRLFDAEGGGSIVVENADGARYPSPQAVLDKLYSSVAFDPIAFTRIAPKDQLETLRKLVKLEVDVDAVRGAIKADYEARQELNRERKQWEGQLGGFADVGEPEAHIPTAPIEEAINSASNRNTEIENRRLRREQTDEERANLRLRVQELEEKLASAKDHLRHLDELIANAEPLPEPVDVADLTRKLSETQAHNRKVERAIEKQAIIKRIGFLQKQTDDLTAAIEKGQTEIQTAISNAAMPVAGLSFGDGEVLFGGLPLDQASSAEQLRISTAIGMATAPELKVMLVRDASLLDEQGFALLAKMAADGGFQFWVEAVADGTKVGIVMEDGAVKDAPTPEPIDKGKRRAKKQDVAGELTGASEQGEGGGSRVADASPAQDTQAASGTAREAPSGSSSGEPSSDTVGAASTGEAVAAASVSPTPKPRQPEPATSLFDD